MGVSAAAGESTAASERGAVGGSGVGATMERLRWSRREASARTSARPSSRPSSLAASLASSRARLVSSVACTLACSVAAATSSLACAFACSSSAACCDTICCMAASLAALARPASSSNEATSLSISAACMASTSPMSTRPSAWHCLRHSSSFSASTHRATHRA